MRCSRNACAAAAARMTSNGVVPAVVGQDVSHLHVTVAGVGERTLEEAHGGRGPLVTERLDVGVPAVVVDGDVEIVQAEWPLAVRAGVRLGEARREALPPARRDPAELLDVQMEQVTGCGVLVADDCAGDAVQMVQTLQSCPAQHAVDRLARDAEFPADAVRTQPVVRLTALMRRAIASGVVCGRCRGVELRSSSPGSPAAS